MLTGDRIALRARLQEDVPVLHAELYDDVELRSRTDPRPWRPLAPDAATSPFASRSGDDADVFSVLELANGGLVGDALLWGIDTHNRNAHLGISLRPGCRGRGLGTDVVRVLCGYGFRVRGLNRLQVETLADNAAMIRSAEQVGFTREGTMRRAAWVQGGFADLVVLGLLADEWSPPTP